MKETTGFCQDENFKESSKKRREIKKKYWIIVLGIVLLFCGYTSFMSLQSSIRIEDGLGSKITMTTYACEIGISLLFGPFIIRVIGAKKTLVTAECSFILYALVNAFSNPVLLYIGAIFAAYAEAIFWIPIGISFVFFAQKYKRYSCKPLSRCIMEFSGMMFSAFQLNYALGNLFASVVLTIFKTLESPLSHDNMTVVNETQENLQSNLSTDTGNQSIGWTSLAPSTDGLLEVQPFDRFMYCGSNDCQDPNITQENIDQYVPESPIALYVLSGCLLLLMVSGMIIHIVHVPNMPLNSFNCSKQSADCDKQASKEDQKNLQNPANFGEQEHTWKEIFVLSSTSFKDTIFLLFHPKQFFLVNPIAVYLGTVVGFIVSEATRAFASCVLGVSQVGVCMVIEASTNSIQAFLIGKVFGKRGRLPLIVFGVLWDVGIYVFCLSWRPTMETSWGVYILFFLLGISNSNWQMIVATIFASDFYKTKEISFSLWCITFAFGFALQLSVSTVLCVSTKLYFSIAWVILAGTASAISEIMNSRKKKEKVLTLTPVKL